MLYCKACQGNRIYRTVLGCYPLCLDCGSKELEVWEDVPLEEQPIEQEDEEIEFEEDL